MNREKINEVFNKRWEIPKSENLKEVINSFRFGEKIIFYFLCFVFIFSGFYLLYKVNESYSIEVPAKGGEVVEGVIGVPRFLNPVLAMTDADRDINSLVYSGLRKYDSDGVLISDLAKSYKISDDGTIYTFFLKPNIYFHDNKKITTDDVEFTISKIKNANIKSPKRGAWEDVTVEKVDELTIKFILKKPYSHFIYNTTIGILPKHIWKNVSDDSFLFSNFNLKPLGSGPYKIESSKEDDSGLPTEYSLTPFKKYIFGEPFIQKITIKFYQNEEKLIEGFKKNEISNINGISPDMIEKLDVKNSEIMTYTLPRIFGVFFNQNNNSIFTHKEVREALSMATPRQDIVSEILKGYGKSIYGPLPKDTSVLDDNRYSIEKARELLEKNGWKMNEFGIYEKKNDKGVLEKLSFSISTSDTLELKNTAYIIQNSWQKIGANVEVKIFEIGDLNQNIIRPRKYDSLLFGKNIGKEIDLFPFWHSSERNDPGLNISMYTNIKVDKILDDLRKSNNQDTTNELLKQFDEEVIKDTPAVFIYSPEFIYIKDKKIKNVILSNITIPADRFQNIDKWYKDTNNVWKIFSK